MASRWGRDRPRLNAGLERQAAGALAANPPMTAVNRPTGWHACDILAFGRRTCEVIRTTLASLRTQLAAEEAVCGTGTAPTHWRLHWASRESPVQGRAERATRLSSARADGGRATAQAAGERPLGRAPRGTRREDGDAEQSGAHEPLGPRGPPPRSLGRSGGAAVAVPLTVSIARAPCAARRGAPRRARHQGGRRVNDSRPGPAPPNTPPPRPRPCLAWGDRHRPSEAPPRQRLCSPGVPQYVPRSFLGGGGLLAGGPAGLPAEGGDDAEEGGAGAPAGVGGLVQDALAHLDDPVHLQTHPLARGLGAPEPLGPPSESCSRITASRSVARGVSLATA